MHLIFERSKGRFQSNCNILALAWMPYYQEVQFRQALFDYHQKQLLNLTRGIQAAEGPTSQQQGNNNHRVGNHRQHREIRTHVCRSSSPCRHHGRQVLTDGAGSVQILPPENRAEADFLNARVAEFHQRYLFMKDSRPIGLTNSVELTANLPGADMNSELDQRYGRMHDFGWLVLGNVGKIAGITLTSTIDPPPYRPNYYGNAGKSKPVDDLMVFDDSEGTQSQPPADSGKITPSLDGQAEDPRRPDRPSARKNYNLRGHMDEIIIVKWNELYQKLATVDSKGNVLFWCKMNEKFTIQTPFYNRTKSVADFKWSNDGKTALICYTDSFIMVGSSNGSRTWHSMLNLSDYHITCASWTPDDEQLLFGVSNGNVVVIDLAGSFLTEILVNRVNIRTMCWSTSELNLRNLDKMSSGLSREDQQPPVDGDGDQNEQNTRPQTEGSPCVSASSCGVKSIVVSQKKLKADCSKLYRYKNCLVGPNDSQNSHLNMSSTSRRKSATCARRNSKQDDFRNILAIDFANSTIKLYDGGLDDSSPKTIQVGLESYIMQWSSDGKILGVAGFNIHTTAPSVGHLKCRYLNAVKFYNQDGQLIYERDLKFKKYPTTAFTWAHDDTRIFVATGPRLHCAKVFLGIKPLSLLASSCLQRNTRLPGKAEVIENTLKGHFGQNIYLWQSHNCPYDLAMEAKRVAAKNAEPQLLAIGDTDDDGDTDSGLGLDQRAIMCNNSNVFNYRLPLKLNTKTDELFSQTIRQPFEESWTLSDIIWHVPCDKRRYFCTLICYRSSQDIGSPAQQYKVEPVNTEREVSDDPYKIFVLYVEFEGSLIPILRARRVGFLKPDFVIFDPEDYSTRLTKHPKVSDVSTHSGESRQLSNRMFDKKKMDDLLAASPLEFIKDISAKRSSAMNNRVDWRQQQLAVATTTTTSDSANDKMPYEQAADYFASKREVSLVTKPNNHLLLYNDRLCKEASPTLPSYMLPMQPDEQLLYLAGVNGVSHHNEIREARAESRAEARSLLIRNKEAGNLPEQKELVRLKSNIWGTKFKMINRSNRVIRQRAILGSMVYKASILHLQPRRIYLNLKDMSNYCSLCSKHHHFRTKRSHHKHQSRTQEHRRHSGRHKETSLIDLPVDSAPERRPSGEKETILLPVGGSLRIAPKLEHNQSYKFASSESESHKSSSRRHHSRGQKHQRKHHTSSSSQPASERHQKSRCPMGNPIVFNDPQPSTSEAAREVREEDDILTLSLGQNDRFEVGMSTSATSSDSKRNKEVGEFLDRNKTLKSIQTITKMIVDLSSKAQDIDSEEQSQPEVDDLHHESPNKLVKLLQEQESGEDLNQSMRASKFVPPDTPVHRPQRRVTSNAIRGVLKQHGYDSVPKAQSAHTTPLKSYFTHKSRHSASQREQPEESMFNPPLPPAPPAMALGRKLSNSAKRLLDGSLRSLYSGSFSSANSDAEQEDNEPLVSRGRHRRAAHRQPASERATRHSSQPCSPSRDLEGRRRKPHSSQRQPSKRSSNIDDALSLRSLLMQKLRDGVSSGSLLGNSSSQIDKTGDQKSSWRYRGTSNSFESVSTESEEEAAAASEGSSEFSDESGDEVRAKPWRLNVSKRFLSMTPAKDPLGATGGGGGGGADGHAKDKSARIRSKPKPKHRKSVCANRHCCCGQQFYLTNRPPVWNELSQVYQLDFGGRVTQESAKNLQIDFEGELALQFGRIDKCTYTLDYRYPFNAVQAMAIALASLTQRLK